MVRASVLHTGGQRFKPSTAHSRYKLRLLDLLFGKLKVVKYKLDYLYVRRRVRE